MTHWNHRVYHSVDEHGEHSFTIREAFYEDGKVNGYTAEPIAPFGETLDELKTELERMRSACDRPVLEDA